jgi:hypothetical protein
MLPNLEGGQEEVHTVADKKFQRDESLGRAGSNRRIGTLETRLEELNQLAQRDTRDAKVDEGLIDPEDGVALRLGRFGLGDRLEG